MRLHPVVLERYRELAESLHPGQLWCVISLIIERLKFGESLCPEEPEQLTAFLHALSNDGYITLH